MVAMVHSINQIRNSNVLPKGVQTISIQEEGTLAVISNLVFQAFPISQSFVVEWQMQRIDLEKFNE